MFSYQCDDIIQISCGIRKLNQFAKLIDFGTSCEKADGSQALIVTNTTL